MNWREHVGVNGTHRSKTSTCMTAHSLLKLTWSTRVWTCWAHSEHSKYALTSSTVQVFGFLPARYSILGLLKRPSGEKKKQRQKHVDVKSCQRRTTALGKEWAHKEEHFFLFFEITQWAPGNPGANCALEWTILWWVDNTKQDNLDLNRLTYPADDTHIDEYLELHVISTKPREKLSPLSALKLVAAFSSTDPPPVFVTTGRLGLNGCTKWKQKANKGSSMLESRTNDTTNYLVPQDNDQLGKSEQTLSESQNNSGSCDGFAKSEQPS